MAGAKLRYSILYQTDPREERAKEGSSTFLIEGKNRSIETTKYLQLVIVTLGKAETDCIDQVPYSSLVTSNRRNRFLTQN